LQEGLIAEQHQQRKSVPDFSPVSFESHARIAVCARDRDFEVQSNLSSCAGGRPANWRTGADH
jgi:hypothetical protein